MHYFRFIQNDIKKHIVLRKYEITLNEKKSVQWIFVNEYSSKVLMPDILPFMQIDTSGNLFAVSEKAKRVFDLFNLPSHSWTPIEVYWEDKIRKKYKLENPFQYYILFIDPLEYTNVIDIKKSIFTDRESVIDGVSFNTAMYRDEPRIEVVKYVFNSNTDAIYLPYCNFAFNEDMKTAFEKIGLEATDICNHYGFSVDVLLNNVEIIEAEQLGHREANRKKIEMLTNDKTTICAVNIELKKLSKIVEDRVARLLSLPEMVKSYYAKKNQENCSSIEIAIRKKEIELNILFPKKYREHLLQNAMPKLFGEYFKALKLPEIVSLGTQKGYWQETTPEAVKSIGIANDGCGEYLGFILENDSDMQLNDTLYQFNHESGTIEVYNQN
jgi:hypothetical protein